MRDIRASGTAFMDSVDGQIEGIRSRQYKRGAKGEVGVVTFAWTKIGEQRKRKARVKEERNFNIPGSRANSKAQT